MANTYLTRTFSSAGNRKKWTWSAWIKRSSGLGSQQCLLACSSGATVFHLVYFDGNDKLNHNYNQTYCNTERVFRDTSGWYHLVCAVDTTQSTASNRVKFYVNGVQETLSGNFPSQNTDMTINNNVRHDISNGGANFNGQFYFDGLMSHIHFCDGYQYQASDFGETDATTGEWKINTSPSVSYGTNGFFILKDGNTVTDSSSNSNTWTANGTLTKTEDCPDNVFATLNPLVSITDAPTFSNGNNSIVISNAGGFGSQSTLGMSSGKYYAEFKMTASSDNDMAVGVNSDTDAPRTDSGAGFGSNSTGYRETGTLAVNGTEDISYGNSYTVNDIIGIAIDLDNNKLYFSKNGTWQNSGDPTSGATGTGALSLTAASSTSSGFYFFNPSCHSGSQGGTWQANFGNGYFGTTAVSSNSGNGYSGTGSLGIFQYQPPTGYTALSTKGLNL